MIKFQFLHSERIVWIQDKGRGLKAHSGLWVQVGMCRGITWERGGETGQTGRRVWWQEAGAGGKLRWTFYEMKTAEKWFIYVSPDSSSFVRLYPLRFGPGFALVLPGRCQESKYRMCIWSGSWTVPLGLPSGMSAPNQQWAKALSVFQTAGQKLLRKAR